jgi:hypothetical protein
MTPVGPGAILLRQLSAGATFDCQFGAFDDGPVVSVDVPAPIGIRHFTISYFDKASVKLSFSMPAEDDK